MNIVFILNNLLLFQSSLIPVRFSFDPKGRGRGKGKIENIYPCFGQGALARCRQLQRGCRLRHCRGNATKRFVVTGGSGTTIMLLCYTGIYIMQNTMVIGGEGNGQLGKKIKIRR